MSYTFEWITPDRILKAQLPLKFDDALAQEFDRDVVAYLDKAQVPVCLIVDLREVKIHPSINTLLSWKQFKHPWFGMTVIVGMTASPIVRFATNIVMKVMGIRLTGARSIEEAMAIVASFEDASKNS